MERGEIWQASLSPVIGSEQGGERPVLIVSRNAINRSSPVVIVCPVSDREQFSRIYPSQVEVSPTPGNGLTKRSVIMGEQVRAISKRRLITRRGAVAPDLLLMLDRALRIALQLE